MQKDLLDIEKLLKLYITRMIIFIKEIAGK